ncbi:MAG: methylmalonyl-CoA epimerase [Bacteroidota bacterium]
MTPSLDPKPKSESSGDSPHFPADLTRIEHLGIAVRSLAESEPLYTRLLGTPPYKSEFIEREGVQTLFYQVGPNKIELLESHRPDSPIARFLESKGEGLHHVAYAVEDILATMQRLRDLGFRLLSEEPLPGADRQWVCFVHPRSAGGVLVELCQPMPALP